MFSSFGWDVDSVDATRYDGMYTALERFRCRPRNGEPTAIIGHTTKGLCVLKTSSRCSELVADGKATQFMGLGARTIRGQTAKHASR